MKLNMKLNIMAALIGIPLVLITVTFIFMTESALERQIRSGRADLAEHLSSRTDAFFNDFEKYITTFLYNYSASGASEEQLEDYLSPMMSQFEYFRIMTIMDKDGNILAYMVVPDETSPGSLERHREMIRPGEVIENAKAYYSEVYADERAGELLRTAAFPFPDGERLLSVEISLDPLQKMVSGVSFGRSGAAFIIDERGRLAAHPSKQRTLSREDMTAIEKIKGILKEEVSGATEYADKDGTTVLGSYHPVHGEWRVVVQESKKDAYYTAIRMKNLAWFAILASVLLAIIASVFISRSIIFPVYKLVTATKKVEKGNFDHSIGLSSHDEMGYLSRAFDRMVEGLKEREFIKDTFSRYVTKQVAEEILKNPDKVALGGKKQEVTILFSDVRGFTTFSESHSPEDVVSHLNEYLSTMVDVIFKHEGTLDKYIGDAIMAVYGSPLPHDDDPIRAIKTAFEMQQRLNELNEKWKAEKKTPLKIGIGVNTGEVIVGNIGDVRRMEYTVIGDNVNLASRIEDLTKNFDCPIIISESTYEKVKECVEVSKLEAVTVKGKTRAVEIYELLSLKS